MWEGEVQDRLSKLKRIERYVDNDSHIWRFCLSAYELILSHRGVAICQKIWAQGPAQALTSECECKSWWNIWNKWEELIESAELVATQIESRIGEWK